MKTSLSLIFVGVRNLRAVVGTVILHLLVLAGFGAFVAWNNGVVLGE